MLIANPIYDTIFKFLMDDNESAKIILSTLLNVDIEELTCYFYYTILLGGR